MKPCSSPEQLQRTLVLARMHATEFAGARLGERIRYDKFTDDRYRAYWRAMDALDRRKIISTPDAVYEELRPGIDLIGGPQSHRELLNDEETLRGMDEAALERVVEEFLQPAASGVTVEDFQAYMPAHQFIFVPTREMWPAASVDAQIPPIPQDEGKPLRASQWLDKHRACEQMTWAPGEPLLIRDRLIADGGWIERAGVTCFNLYRPPTLRRGDYTQADLWVAHVRRLYPENWKHIVKWLAHRVQRPGEKVNHALVLGGLQGIGKDSLLEPVKHAIGAWNFVEVSPSHLLGRFNGFVKSVILRISEARDLGDIDRYSFYDHMKVYTAAPPDVLRCDEKNLREHAVLNVTGVIITTNHKSDGIFLPADDRRHYVAWSDLTRDAFDEEYWRKLYAWYAAGGNEHVAAYLEKFPIAEHFNPKAPPPHTAAFWDIVDASRAPEDAELADLIERLGQPEAITLEELAEVAVGDFANWLKDRKNRRQIPHRLEAAGYVPVRNGNAKDGLWKLGNRRQAVYARNQLAERERIAAATQLAQAIAA